MRVIVLIALMLAAILVPAGMIVLRQQQATNQWCVEHGMVQAQTRDLLCMDPRTRAVYKPE